MLKNKIFILLPDGVGLRNFAYSNFYEIGKEQEFDLVYWNNTPFDLTSLGYNEIKIKNSKSHPLTDIYKNARKQIELNLFIKKTKDNVYDSYRFPFSYNTIKTALKSSFTKLLIGTHSSSCGLKLIRKKIQLGERKTMYYQQSLATLKQENPAFVFCTNQRAMSAIAPVLAAQDLGIPTACFIFSWDNLPKATMVIETDFYFVWSDLMKKELLFYYPYLNENQIIVTGTPQFESHFDCSKLFSREDFFTQNNLDLDKKYICFSGDDITTSPDDPKYLGDLAEAVLKLNMEGNNYGILFRRCPVDFSGRYDEVVKKYCTLIVAVAPKWERKGEVWNTILPTQEDLALQINTIAHTEMVVNLGSSMVFDYVTLDKPCGYFNYNQKIKNESDWDIYTCYRYVHFRSMPSKNAVVWLNDPEEIAEKIKLTLNNPLKNITAAKEWFEKINLHPPQKASIRILKSIKEIIGFLLLIINL